MFLLHKRGAAVSTVKDSTGALVVQKDAALPTVKDSTDGLIAQKPPLRCAAMSLFKV